MEDFKPIINKQQKDQMGCIFASLLLYGNGEGAQEVTSDKLLNILRAARIEPNPFFTNLYSSVLKTVDIKEVALSGVGGGAGAASAPVTSAPTTATTAPVTETKVEEKKVEKDEESASIGGLFGSDDD